MADLFTIRSGGSAMPESSFLQDITDRLLTNGVVSVDDDHFLVEQQAVADMTVKVAVGRAFVKKGTSNGYPIRSDGSINQTITANASGNPRKDAVVLYVDLSATADATASNVAKLIVVAGTPAASPDAPSDSDIATAIGSSNPFIRLANVTVASGATSIVTADIADTRVDAALIAERNVGMDTAGGHRHDGVDSCLISVNRAFPFYISGSPNVANDVGWNPTAPQALTAIKIWAKCKTAPTGADLIVRIYNVTQGAAVGSVTIAASATTGSSTSFTTPAIAQGDVLRVDVTQVGSTVVGANISVVLECTQP